MIIFLNGASSSGKSSIAKSLQELSSAPLLTIGIDSFLAMMPQQYLFIAPKADEGFKFHIEHDEKGPMTSIASGPLGKKMLETMPRVIDMIACDGHDIIVDEVLFDDENICEYVHVLKKHTVYFIGVHCDLEQLLAREKMRGDRVLGLARNQFYHAHGPTRFYDLEIETTNKKPSDCAAEILTFIKNTKEPEGFKKLHEYFYEKQIINIPMHNLNNRSRKIVR